MKWVLSLSIVFFFLGLVSGLSLDMPATALRYETISGKLLGPVEGELTSNQLALYRGQTLVPIDGGLQRLGEETYVWFVSPGTSGTYRIELHNIETRNEGQLIRTSLRQNITIGNQSAPFTFTPGVFVGTKEVNVSFVSRSDSAQTLSIAPFTPSSLTLQAGETRQLTLTFPFVSGFMMGQLGGYAVPTWSTQLNAPSAGPVQDILIQPASLAFTITNGTRLNTTLTLINQGNTSIEKLTLSSSTRDLTFNHSSFLNISRGERVAVTITSHILDENESSTGTITATFAGKKIDFPFSIVAHVETREEKQRNATREELSEPQLYCEDLGGKLCGQSEQCSGQTRTTVQGVCCLERCVLKQTGTTNPALGWLLAGIAVVLLGIGYVLYQRKNRPENISFGASEKNIP